MSKYSRRRREAIQNEPSGRDKLMAALRQRRGVPLELLMRAQTGWYDEFGPADGVGPVMPITALVKDLRAAGLPDLAMAAAEGAFDAARWESDAWAASEEGRETVRQLQDPRYSAMLALARALPETNRPSSRRFRPRGRA